jgi:hypothetical protein
LLKASPNCRIVASSAASPAWAAGAMNRRDAAAMAVISFMIGSFQPD